MAPAVVNAYVAFGALTVVVSAAARSVALACAVAAVGAGAAADGAAVAGAAPVDPVGARDALSARSRALSAAVIGALGLGRADGKMSGVTTITTAVSTSARTVRLSMQVQRDR